jgi:hypothetical protein
MSDAQHITIDDDDGRLLAEADVRTTHQTVQAELRVEAGHLPPGTRTKLVDAVLNSTSADPGTPLKATLPAGDGEMLQRMRERCTTVTTRASGATCQVDTHTPAV